MNRSSSLRYRIISASFALTFVICRLFAIGLFFAFEAAEEGLFEQHVEADLSTFMNQYAAMPDIALVPRENFQVFISKNTDNSGLPSFLLDLPEDFDDIELDGKLLDLEIRQRDETTFYFVIEETALDNFEQTLIISVLIIIFVICLTSILLGAAFSNQIIKPVTKLADKVNSLERSGATGTKPDLQSSDEIEILTEAIDSFQLRVNELLSREREFSTDASHELRSPLMGIQAAAENLQITNDNERISKLAQRIEKRCKQMKSLIDSMLFLARDPTSLENDFTDINFLDVVKDQVDSASSQIESRGINILIVENGKPVIFSSTTILSVVFGNLLRNAVLHSESKDIHIEMHTQGFSIIDFGHGIPDELKDKIFERYNNGRTGSDQGIGIGLSLVKRLCDHFGWDLSVESSQGSGTTTAVDFNQSIRT